MRYSTLLVLGALAAAPIVPVRAQPAPVVRMDGAHGLPKALLDKIGIDTVMDSVIVGTRAVMINALEQRDRTTAQSTEIVDWFLLPEFRARAPERLTRFEDVMAEDVAPDELRAVLVDTSNATRLSAIAKVPRMQQGFTSTGQAWGSQVGLDVFAENKTTLEKLGLDDKALAQ